MSMERYADGLWNHLNQAHPNEMDWVNYTPTKHIHIGNSVWAMRFARYLFYPLQAKNRSGTINHILDHAYGHLLYVLDPQKTIVTVHDLIPLLRWQGHIPGITRGRKPWLNLLSFKALPRARHLVTASQNTKKDLVSRLKCDPKKISVIPYGIDPYFKPYTPLQKELVRHQWGLPDNGAFRILLSGSQFYKNQRKAVEAAALFRKITRKPCLLIKVGPPTAEWYQAIHANHFEQSHICFDNVPLKQMADLYNCVDCLLFPSLYEGFGWPPLEAMACGVPVITSKSASLPEVVGDAGVLCDPEDIEALADALVQMFGNEEWKSLMVEKGLARAQLFDWQKVVKSLFSLYQQILTE
ncbi:MAG: glycosyltransferase family 4 protein [Anaerolineaceae bacterium]|nr:glycosyltransferase family 4 protein [Anaerolineaceae bacterium]